MPRVYIIPALQSTPTFAVHFNVPGISSCIYSKSKKCFQKRNEFIIIILLMHLVTVQTKYKVVS